MTLKSDTFKTKILHILATQPNPVALTFKNPNEYIQKHDDAEYIIINKPPFWVGFFDDFHHKMAVETLKATENYQIECWRPYWKFISRPYEKLNKGVLHKVFPSVHLRIPKIIDRIWSPTFLNSLKKEIESSHKLLIHIHDGHSDFITDLLLKLQPLHIPVIYQHRGGWMYNFDYQYRVKNPISLLKHRKEKEKFRFISHYLSGSKYEYEFIRDELGFENVSYFMDGIDFDYFKPGNKLEIRKQLGLPEDKKIIIYVGRFDYANGVDSLINVYKRLRENNLNVELLLVGGYKTNPLYKKAKLAGAIVIERVQESKLLQYYQAADIYVMAIKDSLYRMFGGIGTATLQALATGVPALTYNISHFPAPESEIRKVGRTFLTDEELYQNAVYMLTHLDEFKQCRDITRKYYDKNVTISNLIELYEKLFKEYYP